ncbi:MAG: CoA-binding protein [Bacteroidetes bacterium CG2_30_32_10]|nr:MAG: CoA-binding protein [Bacteroidetes bacterium CG2_30_32_10]
MKKTIVLGASPNADRYSYRAVIALLSKGYEVVPIGIKTGTIEKTPIINGTPDIEKVHTITLYLNPSNQKLYYTYILKLQPQRVIFNPGTYNPELIDLLEKNKIEVIQDCTLIMLSMGTF